MKNTFFVFLLLSTYFSFAQSKKEQLETLKLSIDSLSNVLTSERKFSIQNNLYLNSEIDSLENKIKILNTRIDEIDNKRNLLKESNSEKDKIIEKKTDEINGLLQTIRLLRDSIKNTSPIIDTLEWEIPDSLTWNQVSFNLKLPLPKSKFNAPTGNLLISRDKKILISYYYNYTHELSEDEGNPFFYKEQDAINYYSKGLKDIEITNYEGFIIKGKNAYNQLIIIKGIYDEFASMQGREEGEPTWLWSNTLIIKIKAEQSDVVDFNYISNLLINGFSTKSLTDKK
jgi:hypothetical protein